MLNIPVYKD